MRVQGPDVSGFVNLKIHCSLSHRFVKGRSRELPVAQFRDPPVKSRAELTRERIRHLRKVMHEHA